MLEGERGKKQVAVKEIDTTLSGVEKKRVQMRSASKRREMPLISEGNKHPPPHRRDECFEVCSMQCAVQK